MALLNRSLVLVVLSAAATACYSPAVRDCTVSCEAPGDCAHGQVCGSDHLCAAPSIAGSCAQQPRDAGVDTPLHDAPPPRDAPPIDAAILYVDLHVKIDGQGRVVVANIGICDTALPNHGDCHYTVVAGVNVMLQEVETTQRFDKWTGACGGGNSTCTVSSTSNIDVHARFAN